MDNSFIQAFHAICIFLLAISRTLYANTVCYNSNKILKKIVCKRIPYGSGIVELNRTILKRRNLERNVLLTRLSV